MNKIKIFSLMLAILFAACQKDPVSSTNGQSRIALSVQYTNSPLLKAGTGSMKKLPQINAITITRARFLVRNVTLRAIPEDSVEFVSDPYIMDLNLDGQPTMIEIKDVPADTYDRIDFRIHRLDDDDPRDMAFFQHPDFQDFVSDNRYSMIIEGIISDGNNPEATFVFRSRDNEKKRHFFDPVLVVDESTSQVTVTFKIDGSHWFVSGDGSLLDPRDESNEGEISDNLRESIRVDQNKPSNDSGNDDGGNDDNGNDDNGYDDSGNDDRDY